MDHCKYLSHSTLTLTYLDDTSQSGSNAHGFCPSRSLVSLKGHNYVWRGCNLEFWGALYSLFSRGKIFFLYYKIKYLSYRKKETSFQQKYFVSVYYTNSYIIHWIPSGSSPVINLRKWRRWKLTTLRLSGTIRNQRGKEVRRDVFRYIRTTLVQLWSGVFLSCTHIMFCS